MPAAVAALLEGTSARDYSLVGPEAERARLDGLVDAEWFRPAIDPDRLRALTTRTNGRAVVDLALWLALLVGFGSAAVLALGSWWAVPLFLVYGALYGGAVDARWHEFGHGTAAASERLNDAVYFFACVLCWRGPTLWRWSHFRHHSDTIIVGRDPEIQLGRPARMRAFALNFTNLVNGPRSLWRLMQHAAGRIDAEALDFVPAHEQRKLVVEARVIVGIMGTAFAASIVSGSWVPVLLVGLPTIYGAWLMVFFGATQHLGLREDVLDHRATTRTVYVNPVFRFLYLNMNYHVEHHLFPAVPYYNLPALHAEIKDALPAPSPSMWHAYREIVSALWKQRRDPDYEIVTRVIPVAEPAESTAAFVGGERPDGSLDLGVIDRFAVGAPVRVDVGDRTFAVARLSADRVCVIDGFCTHGRAHLADGALIDSPDGVQIECPKHNGRFDVATGAPCRKPVTQPVTTHAVTIVAGHIITTPKSHPDQVQTRLGDCSVTFEPGPDVTE